MKKIASIAAAATASLALFTAPTAGAQDLLALGVFDTVASGLIQGADCATVKSTLTLIDQNTEGVLLDENTTRDQLASNLQGLGGQKLSITNPLSLAALKYSNQTADKALSCGIVKANPETNDLMSLSSKVTQYAPLLVQLSSAAK
ncbi:hypothetical protein [uncultured Corynebacterium sp.]|uniref:hypothetical protein n=1 Tax=uncultured Corynebacterium sp. TaxID=159447 RepID=UPI0025FC4873|nr:hypothetical protein [uncultured Corynebacterium sp.]